MSDPLDWLPEALEPVAFRLARADECAYKIGDLTSAWSMGGPVRFRHTLSEGVATSVVDSVRPIPPRVAILFSEAIGHIRASLDNVMWHIVTEQTDELTDYAERLVEFPITNNSDRFTQWCEKRVKNGLKMFSEDSVLAARLRSLQTWNDGIAVAPSVSQTMATLRKMPSEKAQALRLLQAYSNHDKHRAIQTAAFRTSITNFDRPILEQDLRFKNLEPGTIVRKGKAGTYSLIELHPAVLIVRPAPFKDAVNPAREINHLRQYVSETAIPVMIRGLALAYKLPPEIDLSDNGQTPRERLREAGDQDATQRVLPLLKSRFEDEMGLGHEDAQRVPASCEDVSRH